MNLFWKVFLAGSLLELFSFLTWYLPVLRLPAMIVLAFVAIFLARKDPRMLFGFLLLEMVIGSHGHLFFTDLGGFRLSLRMTLFGILAASWLARRLKSRVPVLVRPDQNRRIGMAMCFVILAVAWGSARGVMQGRGFGAVFADANAYAFLLLIPIALDLLKERDVFEKIKQVCAGALLWLSVKSLLLAYLVSHHFGHFLSDLYLWQRKFWLTEITRLGDGGWVRVFAASDIFLIFGVFGAELLLWRGTKNRRLWAWSAIIAAAFLLSLSRSLWLGVFGSAFLLTIPFFRLKLGGWHDLWIIAKRDAALLALGLAVIAGLVYVPLPERLTRGSLASLFAARLTEGDDAAISSRWNMLPPLNKAIATSPILGSGFGATITYQSDDPRIHALYPGGVITTSAIEWQYLEIWLKAGLVGLLSVFFLLFSIGKETLAAFRTADQGGKEWLFVSLLSLVAFMIVNVFTPYLNHPLGWMFLALIVAGSRAISSRPSR